MSEESGTSSATPSILSASGVMAAGTLISRLTGFVRASLLAAAIGVSLQGEVFNVANTIPNSLYILVAGGVFNTVLVPQLVRAIKNDADGGDAYANRIITLGAIVLAGVTAVLVLAAPVLMRVVVDGSWFTDPALSAEKESLIDFARWCLPQIFFYGMFVLLGQILNARRKFGPMMWAPILNNLISITVIIVYLVVYSGPQPGGGYSTSQEMLLGSWLNSRHRRAGRDLAPLPESQRIQNLAPIRLQRHRARSHPAAGNVDRRLRHRQPVGVLRDGPPCHRRDGPGRQRCL